MRNVLSEVWLVLRYSPRTQLAIALGLISFSATLLMGERLVGSLEFHGPLAPMTDLIRQRLMHRYDTAAWGVLGSFALLAVKTYRKDRRRLFDA